MFPDALYCPTPLSQAHVHQGATPRPVWLRVLTQQDLLLRCGRWRFDGRNHGETILFRKLCLEAAHSEVSDMFRVIEDDLWWVNGFMTTLADGVVDFSVDISIFLQLDDFLQSNLQLRGPHGRGRSWWRYRQHNHRTIECDREAQVIFLPATKCFKYLFTVIRRTLSRLSMDPFLFFLASKSSNRNFPLWCSMPYSE